MIDCNNLCFYSGSICEHCKKHYNVSEHFFIAKRSCNEEYVVGYLVCDKQDRVLGMLTKKSNFKKVSLIDKTTLKLAKIQDLKFKK